MHPSQFPKRADGTRFYVFRVAFDDSFNVYAGDKLLAECRTKAMAEMVAAALEFQARDGETFILEDGKCK